MITTLPILRIRAVSQRLLNLVDHIVHMRLLAAASFSEWKLIIECYHPTSQYSEPYFFCEYLGILGLDRNGRAQSSDGVPKNVLSNLEGLVARFQPTMSSPERKVRRSHPAGDIPGSRTMEMATSSSPATEETVRRYVKLESHENFSQLIFSASLVKLGPRKGVFLDIADLVDRKTMRVFRDWLCHQSQLSETNLGCGEDELCGIDEETDANTEKDELVWVDEEKKIARLSIGVRELRSRKDRPILVMNDEYEAASFSLELKGASNYILLYQSRADTL